MTEPQSAEAVRAGDARACGPWSYNDVKEAAHLAATGEWRQAVADKIGELLPDDLSFGWEPSPPTYADIAATMARFAPRPLRTELHCHQDAIKALRDRAAAQVGEDNLPAGLTRLCGIDIIEDADLGPGEWELREDGKTVQSGRIGT